MKVCPQISSTVKWKVTALVSILSAVGLMVLYLKANFLFHHIVAQMMQLIEGGPVYDAWRAPTLPTYTTMYLWNVTNANEVARLGAKPNLQEVGPFVFEETVEKVGIQHYHDNGTVSYTRKRFWYFIEEFSAASLDDNITTINFPAMAAVGASKNMGYWERYGLFQTLSFMGIGPFVTKPAREFLFDGYDDMLLSIASMSGQDSCGKPMDKFGWFYKRNGTTWAEGMYNTFTGETEEQLFGRIDTYDGQRRTHYKGHCGSIKGSAEGFFPPFGAMDMMGSRAGDMPEVLELYTNEACRTLEFKKVAGESFEQSGLMGTKYSLDHTTFGNTSVNEDNWCYENNLPSGVQNITHCKACNGVGAPIFLSFPHFYNADPWYLDQFDNRSDLRPEQEKHEAHMVLENTLSIPLVINFRLQLVVKIDPEPEVEAFSHLPSDLYLPTIWFQAHMQLPEFESEMMYQVVHIPSTMTLTAIVGVALNSIIFMLSLYCLMIRRQRSTGTQVDSPVTVTENLDQKMSESPKSDQKSVDSSDTESCRDVIEVTKL